MQPTNFPFGKELKVYRYDGIETPFLKKKQMCDMPIGEWRYKAYFWRLLFFINMSISILLLLFFIMLVNVRPFNIAVVSITKEGHVRAVNMLDLSQKANLSLYTDFIHVGIATMLGELNGEKETQENQKRLKLFWSHSAKKAIKRFLIVTSANGLVFKHCIFDQKTNLICELRIHSKDSQSLSKPYRLQLKWGQKIPNTEALIQLNPLGMLIKDAAIINNNASIS